MDRLSAEDSFFLSIETPTQPMHVGSLAVFEGKPWFGPDGRFRIDDVREEVGRRLHLVPRFRQRVRFVPLDQGRPVWVDDHKLDLTYHVRLTALPRPGDDEQLMTLMQRIQEQPLDRARPLWEMWYVEGLAGDRVALIQKTHHCMVDGVAGVDVATVMLDLEREPDPIDAGEWVPEKPLSSMELLARSYVEMATDPAQMARSVRSAAMRGPKVVANTVGGVSRALTNMGRIAPRTSWNVPISGHRRFEVARVPLAPLKSVKDAGGYTINDIVLTVVSGALRQFLDSRGESFEPDLLLRAMVPVSVRDETDEHALGNRVSLMIVDLPVGNPDPLERMRIVGEHMREAKASHQALGADALISLTSYAPPTLLNLASRLMVRQRSMNLTVTNVPGPQVPLYAMGAEMLEAFPYVGLVENQGLMLALISYNGELGFGLTGDRETVPDIDVLARAIEDNFYELQELVG